MAWVIRLFGLAFAMTAAAALTIAVPVGTHYGVTPIHCTRADTAMFAIGYFLLFYAITFFALERVIVVLSRPRMRRSDRIPIARIIVR